VLPVLCLILLAASRAAHADSSPVIFGANLPFFYYGDTGCNVWGCRGYSTEGWVSETRGTAKCLGDVGRVASSPITGRPALEINANCASGDPLLASGEVYTEPLVTQPAACPRRSSATVLNLDGVTARARLCVPAGASGPVATPHMFRFLFKSRTGDEFLTLLSEPVLMNPTWEGRCTDISYELSRTSPGERAARFDPSRVVLAGIRFQMNPSAAGARFQGRFYLERFTLETRPAPTVFDFDLTQLERDFRAIREIARGLGLPRVVVRVFTFTDGRTGIVYGRDGTITGLDGRVFLDFDALVSAAHSTGVGLIPVILDHTWFRRAQTVVGVQLGGRTGLLRNRTGIENFRDHVLHPILARYGSHPAIYAWDLVNEPELATSGIGGFTPDRAYEPLTLAEMREFIRAGADSINRLTFQRGTVGSGRPSWVTQWRGLGLTLYSMHYYDTERREVFPWRPVRELQLDQPVLVTEVPTRNTRYRAGDYLRAARLGGYEGVCLWSCRSQDEFADLPTAAGDLASRVPVIEPRGVANAASLVDSAAVSPDGIFRLTGSSLAPDDNRAAAPAAPPVSLDGVSISIRDATGLARPARMLFVSPEQISFVTPGRLAPGSGRLTVSRADGASASIDVSIVPVVPGLFSADGEGRGAAAAAVTRMRGGRTLSTTDTYRCLSGGRGCQNLPIDFGPEGDSLVLTLFGTGFRQQTNLAAFTVRVGQLALPASFAGPREDFAGLDHVDAVLPRSLAGGGVVNVSLSVDGAVSNTVTVQFR